MRKIAGFQFSYVDDNAFDYITASSATDTDPEVMSFKAHAKQIEDLELSTEYGRMEPAERQRLMTKDPRRYQAIVDQWARTMKPLF